MTERRAHLRIGIDTGGTYTDIVSVDGASGAMRVTKVASTPSNPAIGLVRGVKAILDAGGASVDDLAGLAHGTTVAGWSWLPPFLSRFHMSGLLPASPSAPPCCLWTSSS